MLKFQLAEFSKEKINCSGILEMTISKNSVEKVLPRSIHDPKEIVQEF